MPLRILMFLKDDAVESEGTYALLAGADAAVLAYCQRIVSDEDMRQEFEAERRDGEERNKTDA
jgi:hypothetical protein